jgi:EAL domain-containing protein (putative c-di-GMP-specific phosphodiesterase class I)
MQLAQWQLADNAFQMAVNISAVQIQRDGMLDTIHELYEKYNVDLTAIELEVTESVLINFPQKAVEVLNDVREMGLSVALDDFGTGFSSLSNLKAYPINTIKVDKSFVMDMLQDPNDAAITKAVIAMGKSLDMHVVAEGVETKAHVQFLQDLGCHQAQGYYYSRPVPADEFTKNFIS